MASNEWPTCFGLSTMGHILHWWRRTFSQRHRGGWNRTVPAPAAIGNRARASRKHEALPRRDWRSLLALRIRRNHATGRRNAIHMRPGGQDMLNRIKTALSRPLVDWVERAPDDRVYAERFNRLQPYRANVRIRVECDEDRSLLRICDGNESIWISRRSRLPHQIGGLSKRRVQLQQDYLVPDGLVRPGDLVIDCGANVGEFAIICARAGAHVLAFEPDPREFAALAANS